MPNYYIALTIRRPPYFGDNQLRDLLRTAVTRAMCVVIEITSMGLVVDADVGAIPTLESSLRFMVSEAGGELLDIKTSPI